MNVRLYDPRIGRFFSPDNYISQPENPQNYNRYSYALNNPLKFVDPSGNVPLTGYSEWDCGLSYVLTSGMGCISNMIAYLSAIDNLDMNNFGYSPNLGMNSNDLLNFNLTPEFYVDAQIDRTNTQAGKLPIYLTFTAFDMSRYTKVEREKMQNNYSVARMQLQSLYPDYQIPFGVTVSPEDGRRLATESAIGKKRGAKYYPGLSFYETNAMYIDSNILLNNESLDPTVWGGMELPMKKPKPGIYTYAERYSLLDTLAHETAHFMDFYINESRLFYMSYDELGYRAVEFNNIIRKLLGLPLEINRWKNNE